MMGSWVALTSLKIVPLYTPVHGKHYTYVTATNSELEAVIASSHQLKLKVRDQEGKRWAQLIGR